MKKFITQLAIYLAITTSAAAEPILKSKPVQCAPPIEVINHYVVGNNLKAMYIGVAQVQNQYGEIAPTAISFWVDPKTLQFILIEGDKTEVCIISIGNNLDFNVNSSELLELYLQQQ